ncbi:MAG: hypothetical protein ABI573_00670, partial [Chloroflexota bacterium]
RVLLDHGRSGWRRHLQPSPENLADLPREMTRRSLRIAERERGEAGKRPASNSLEINPAP